MKFNKHGIAKPFKFESLFARNNHLQITTNNHLQITTNKQWSKPKNNVTILQ